jgi:hypothetical protein
MLFSRFKRKMASPEAYDKTALEPVIRSSICTGEKVAGFRERETGRFREVSLIRSAADLEAFKKKYGIHEDIPVIY